MGCLPLCQIYVKSPPLYIVLESVVQRLGDPYRYIIDWLLESDQPFFGTKKIATRNLTSPILPVRKDGCVWNELGKIGRLKPPTFDALKVVVSLLLLQSSELFCDSNSSHSILDASLVAKFLHC
jgi:hypothetical protein